jgi:hypothetical protein
MLRHLVAASALLLGCNSILGVQDRYLEEPLPMDGQGGTPPIDDCLPDASETRTGFIQVDGLLDVADAMIDRFETIESDFQSSMLVMASALGVDTTDGYSGALVDAVLAALTDQVAASTEHGVSVFLPELRCRVDYPLVLAQQNLCEGQSGCDTSSESTELSCQGLCHGQCEGRCDGCRAPIDGRCMGACVGTCTQDFPQACDGSCQGTCSGTCTALDRDGNCDGSCDGDCGGDCELFQAGGCAEECKGTCDTIVNGKCLGLAQCHGTCDSPVPGAQVACKGECVGRAVPIPGDPECELAPLCKLQSSLLGTMRMTCDPIDIVERHTLRETLTPAEKVKFESRVTSVIATSRNILNGLALVEIIAAGQLVGRMLTDPPPYDVTYNALKDIADHAERGQPIPGVPDDCASEIGPYVASTVLTLEELKPRGTDLVGDQLKFVLALQSGFR